MAARQPDIRLKTAADLAAWFAVSPRSVERWRAMGSPAPTATGWSARATAQWLATSRKASKVNGEPVDPLLTGDSPALEDYRRARARLAELDLDERRGKLIPRDKVRDSLARISAILRNAGDTLVRQHKEAADVLFEALDDCEREIRSEYDRDS